MDQSGKIFILTIIIPLWICEKGLFFLLKDLIKNKIHTQPATVIDCVNHIKISY